MLNESRYYEDTSEICKGRRMNHYEEVGRNTHESSKFVVPFCKLPFRYKLSRAVHHKIDSALAGK